MGLTVEWSGAGRGPQEPSDPLYPHGKDVDVSEGAKAVCETALQCPAPECGLWIVRCDACGVKVGVTAAGRPDDPRSFKMACRTPAARYLHDYEPGEYDPQVSQQPGPTGDFPDGKLKDDDQGGIAVAVGVSPADGKSVIINFGKPVAWIGLAPEQAIEFAFSILTHAGVTIGEAKPT